MLLELVLVITKRESIPSRLMVLVDTQREHGAQRSLPRRRGPQHLAGKLEARRHRPAAQGSRLELARRALAKALDQLGRGARVSVYGFSHQSAPIEGDALQSAEPKGTETAIGDALSAALAEHRGQPLAGVLLVSDGQSNAGEDPRKVAEQAGKQGVPIVSLAVGTHEGPSNARLAAIEADPVVFVRDPTEIAVLVEGQGMTAVPAW